MFVSVDRVTKRCENANTVFSSKNWKINKGVKWLKIVQALWSLGVMIIYPFINLQMPSLGLNTEDISLVNGLIPLAIMITTPIAGR